MNQRGEKKGSGLFCFFFWLTRHTFRAGAPYNRYPAIGTQVHTPLNVPQISKEKKNTFSVLV